MIEFKVCPEFPFWFAQTKFSLWECTKKEIRVSKDSSKTESLNAMKERNHGWLECSFPHKMGEVIKIKYLRFRASWRRKIRKSIDNGGFPLSNYKNVLLHKIASYNNSMSFVWCKIYILQLVSSKVHIAHNLLSRTILQHCTLITLDLDLIQISKCKTVQLGDQLGPPPPPH